jgi:hypothetical protein
VSIEVLHFGGWRIASRPPRDGGFIAWAKFGEIHGTHPIDEPGEHAWFEFGSTRDEAISKLRAELAI